MWSVGNCLSIHQVYLDSDRLFRMSDGILNHTDYWELTSRIWVSDLEGHFKDAQRNQAEVPLLSRDRPSRLWAFSFHLFANLVASTALPQRSQIAHPGTSRPQRKPYRFILTSYLSIRGSFNINSALHKATDATTTSRKHQTSTLNIHSREYAST